MGMSKRTARPEIPALPEGAIGFIGRHPKRPERMAMISPAGEPLAWFGQDDTVQSVADELRSRGHLVSDEGFLLAAA